MLSYHLGGTYDYTAHTVTADHNGFACMLPGQPQKSWLLSCLSGPIVEPLI